MFTINAGGPDAIQESDNPTPIILSNAEIGGGAITAAWALTSGQGLLSNVEQTDSPAIVTFTPSPNFFGTVILTLTTNSPGAVSANRIINIEQVLSYPEDLSTISLYNATLKNDKQYIDQCVVAISSEIQNHIDNELDPSFNIDLTSILGTLSVQQQNRIKDEIIYHFRNLGIRVVSSYLYVPSVVETNNNDSLNADLTLHVSWFIRDAREYMKTYV